MRTEKISVVILSLCFLIAALFPSFTGAQEPESTPGDTSPAKVPHIVIDAAQYDVGEIYEGETIVHAFTVKNTGTAELSIKDVKAG